MGFLVRQSAGLARHSSGNLSAWAMRSARHHLTCSALFKPSLPADLEELDLSSNEFTCLPPALSAAIALTRLSISGNTELALCQADAALLLALPHLKFLEIARCCPAAPALLEELEQRMPQLFICMW